MMKKIDKYISKRERERESLFNIVKVYSRCEA